MKKFNLIFLSFIFFPLLGLAQGAPDGLDALTITELANGDNKYSLY